MYQHTRVSEEVPVTVSERKSCAVAARAVERFEAIIAEVFPSPGSVSKGDPEEADDDGDMALNGLQKMRVTIGSRRFRELIVFK
jgi:hypothetical protein